MSCKDHIIYEYAPIRTNIRYAMAIPTGTIVGVGLMSNCLVVCTRDDLFLCEGLGMRTRSGTGYVEPRLPKISLRQVCTCHVVTSVDAYPISCQNETAASSWFSNRSDKKGIVIQILQKESLMFECLNDHVADLT